MAFSVDDTLKITLIGTLPPLKGLSPYCLSLARALEQEVDLEFLGFGRIYPDWFYPGGSRIKTSASTQLPLKRTQVRLLLTYYNPLSWIWAGLTLKGQVVHAQWWSYVLAFPYLVILALSKLRRRRCVITVHNIVPHENHKLAGLLNRSILRFGDHFIVHNQRNQELLTSRFGIPSRHINIIPHGVLEPAPLARLTQGQARKDLGIFQDARVVLYFGNIREYKGLEDLIEAMEHVVAEDPHAFLVIAGQPWGPSDSYQKKINDSGLKEYTLLHLSFIPPENVETFFAASDILVLPYKYFDSQSGIAALSLFYGLPMVVTDVGGLPEVAVDPRMVVPPGDVPALARALSMALRDDAFLKGLAVKTREKAANFQWDDIAKATVEVYRGLLPG